MFTSIRAKITTKAREKEVILKADRNIFSRLLVINEKCGIGLREVLKFSLGPIAWSLANFRWHHLQDGEVKSIRRD